METREQIETVFNRFKTLQESHIKALGDENTDMERLIFERDRAFEDLRSSLSAIPGIGISEACKRQVSNILKMDKLLAEKIVMRKNQLSKSITSSKEGKKALKGYQGLPNTSLRFMKTTG